MADFTKNLADTMVFADELLQNPYRRILYESVTIGPSGLIAPSGYVNGNMISKFLAETINILPSGVADKEDIPNVIEYILLGTSGDSITPSGVMSDGSTILLGESWNGVPASGVREDGSSVSFLAPSGQYQLPTSEPLTVALVDSVTKTIYATLTVYDNMGTYYGRVPIDVTIFGSGTFSVSAQYLNYGTWQDAFLSDNTNLVAGSPANSYRVWWECGINLASAISTKLKINITGCQKTFVTSMFSVSLDLSSAKIPVFSMMGWSNPQTVLAPSGYFTVLNPAGYSVKEINMEASQYIYENKFTKFDDVSSLSMTNLVFDNGCLRLTGYDKYIDDETLVTSGLQYAFHCSDEYDWVNRMKWFNTGSFTQDVYGLTGEAMYFYSSTSCLKPTNDFTVPIGTTYSFATWFKYPLGSGITTYNTLFVIGTYKVSVRSSDGNLVIYDTATSVTHDSTFSLNSLSTAWHFLIMEADGNVVRFYIDNVYRYFVPIIPTGNLTFIGNASASSNEWFGIIDELRIYNKVLTADEKSQLNGQHSSQGYISGVFDAGKNVHWYSFELDSFLKSDCSIACSFRTSLEEEGESALATKTLASPELSNSLMSATRVFTSSGTLVVGENTTIEVYAWGAGGAGGTPGGWSYGSPGGAGGAAYGKITLTAGSYPIIVGGQGVVNTYSYAVGGGGRASNNNSDNRYTGGGGGYSGIFMTSVTQGNALLIAGGGGGGGSSRAGSGNVGGAGGGATGQDGTSAYDGKVAYRGRGATQSAAGENATSDSANGGGEQAALLGGSPRTSSYGGGGGGGYWGGSAGGYSESNTMAGGGGGSSYYNPSYVTDAVLTAGSGMTPGDSTNILRGIYGNAGAVATNGVGGIIIVKYTTTTDAGWSGGTRTISIDRVPVAATASLTGLNYGRYLEFKAYLNASSNLLVSPKIYGAKFIYENRDYLQNNGWASVSPNSFVLDTYNDWYNKTGDFSATNVPGSVTARKQGWTYQRKITLNRAKVQRKMNGSVIIVNLTSDSSLSTNAKADGSDIRFTDANGNVLPFEIEYYNAGTLRAWVNVDLLLDQNSSADQYIYMYYGNSAVGAVGVQKDYGQYNVWDDDYCFVSHKVYGGLDSTKYTNNLTASGTVQDWSVNAPLYRGGYFDGTCYYLGQVSSFPNKNWNRTIECQIRVDVWPTAGNRYCIFAMGALTTGNPDIFGVFVNENQQIVIGNTYSNTFVSSSNTLQTGVVYYLAITYTNDTIFVRIAGNTESFAFSAMPVKDTYLFSIGANIDGNIKAKVYLDEVRVSSCKRDADLLTTNYNIEQLTSWLTFDAATSGYKMFPQEESGITNYVSSGYIEGFVDAGRDVDWGKFEKEVVNGSSLIYKFRSATNSEGESALSGKSWNISTNNMINAINGRYLGWRVEMTAPESIVRTFTTGDSLVVGESATAEVLLVAGGGGGGDNGNVRGSGGGAGGVINITSFPLSAGTYTVTVGNGGGEAVSGQNTVLTGNGRTLTALGGGRGGYNDNTNNGQSGGSGGGQWYPGYTGAASTQPSTTNDGISTYANSGFGNKGGDSSNTQPYGSGGGGAGAAGSNWNGPLGPTGGIGKQFSTNGTPTYYAGGGGSGSYPPQGDYKYDGGLGGGGRGWNNGTEAQQNGTANTGGGGGAGGSGGSGIIIVKYTSETDTGWSGGTKTTFFDTSWTAEIKSLKFWCWDNKAIYPLDKAWSAMTLSNITVTDSVVTLTSKSATGYITDIVDLSSDKDLDYMVFDDRTNNSTSILYQYRYATDAEGSGALSGKLWIDSNSDLSGIVARYVEWKATLTPYASAYSPEIRKMVLGYGGYDRQYVQMSSMDVNNIGKLAFRFCARDEAHSRFNFDNTVKEALFVDNDIPVVSSAPLIQWTNAVDPDINQSMRYVVNLVSETNISDMGYIKTISKETTSDFNGYYTKSSSVSISNNTIALSSSQTYGEIVYRISDSKNMIVNKFKALSNIDKNYSGYRIKYFVRQSNNNIDYGEYTEVTSDERVLLNAKYIEVTIRFYWMFGSTMPIVNSFSLEYWTGNMSFMVDETPVYSELDLAETEYVLTPNTYYYVRVCAFDGEEYSYWSKVQIFKTQEELIPAPTDLMTENISENDRVITFNPEFTWQFNQLLHQQKYAKVQIGQASGVYDWWNSGKVGVPPSGIMPSGVSPSGIRYDYVVPSGSPSPASTLIRGRRYHWKAGVWNELDMVSELSSNATFKLNQLPTKPIVITALD